MKNTNTNDSPENESYSDLGRKVSEIDKDIEAIMYNQEIFDWPDKEVTLLDWIKNKENIEDSHKERLNKIINEKILVKEMISKKLNKD
ncbi:MAG: hypothetical protein CMO01_20250 [Thalassobius sp.]|nr:hypothetical protein [Thalassovita sp.]